MHVKNSQLYTASAFRCFGVQMECLQIYTMVMQSVALLLVWIFETADVLHNAMADLVEVEILVAT